MHEITDPPDHRERILQVLHIAHPYRELLRQRFDLRLGVLLLVTDDRSGRSARTFSVIHVLVPPTRGFVWVRCLSDHSSG